MMKVFRLCDCDENFGRFKSVRPITSARKIFRRMCVSFNIHEKEITFDICDIQSGKKYKYRGRRMNNLDEICIDNKPKFLRKYKHEIKRIY